MSDPESMTYLNTQVSEFRVSTLTWHDDLVAGNTLRWELIAVAVIAEQGLILAGKGLICQRAIAAETAEAVLMIMPVFIKELLEVKEIRILVVISYTVVNTSLKIISLFHSFWMIKKTNNLFVVTTGAKEYGIGLGQTDTTAYAAISMWLICVCVCTYHTCVPASVFQRWIWIDCLQGTKSRKCCLYLLSTTCEGVDL